MHDYLPPLSDLLCALHFAAVFHFAFAFDFLIFVAIFGFVIFVFATGIAFAFALFGVFFFLISLLFSVYECWLALLICFCFPFRLLIFGFYFCNRHCFRFFF